MLKKDREEYKRKLQFISEHAKRIDYDWFHNGKILFVEDLQYDNVYYIGYFAMDRKGVFYVYEDIHNEYPTYCWNEKTDSIKLLSIQPKKYDKINSELGDNIDWLFKYISVNNLMWMTNKIYSELTHLSG
jgi:hypothetical protein